MKSFPVMVSTMVDFFVIGLISVDFVTSVGFGVVVNNVALIHFFLPYNLGHSNEARLECFLKEQFWCLKNEWDQGRCRSNVRQKSNENE